MKNVRQTSIYGCIAHGDEKSVEHMRVSERDLWLSIGPPAGGDVDQVLCDPHTLLHNEDQHEGVAADL